MFRFSPSASPSPIPPSAAMSLKIFSSLFLLCLAVFGLSCVAAESQTVTVQDGETVEIGGQKLQIRMKQQPEADVSVNPEADLQTYDQYIEVCSYCNNYGECGVLDDCQVYDLYDPYDPYPDEPCLEIINSCTFDVFYIRVTSFEYGTMRFVRYSDPSCSYPAGPSLLACNVCDATSMLSVSCPYYRQPRRFTVCGTCEPGYDPYCDESDTCESFSYTAGRCYNIRNPCTNEPMSSIMPYYWDGEIMEFFEWQSAGCTTLPLGNSQIDCRDCQQPAGVNFVCSPAASFISAWNSLFSVALSLIAAAVFSRKAIA